MCKELVEIELRNNPFMNKMSIKDVAQALPNLRVIDSTQVNELKGDKILHAKICPVKSGKYLTDKMIIFFIIKNYLTRFSLYET
jgi:hypothetical protein